eukprot:TRINITY_DN19758_c0_g1_i1.p1 TRINITY_DN19758_c0_g1~~TRINITY_DN19758_c0_g1_i1.p1  ORF type:complete len:286 (+),score=99.33 TRINITY_DN19758_c0_g1_i1:78-935(+)
MQSVQFMMPQQFMMISQNGMIMPVMCMPQQQPVVFMQPTMMPTMAAMQPYVKFSDEKHETRSANGSLSDQTSTNDEVASNNTIQSGNAVLSAVLRASGNTPVTGLAGALAKRLRNKQEVVVEAMGPASVAQAMRALVLARSFLFQEGIMITGNSEFMFAPSREQGSLSPHPGLRFTVTGKQAKDETTFDENLSITDESVVGKAAGAIAKLVRSTGTKGGVIGLTFGPSPNAINLAAKAMTLSRAMLSDDDLDIIMEPMMPKQTSGPRVQPEDQVLEFAVITRQKM